MPNADGSPLPGEADYVAPVVTPPEFTVTKEDDGMFKVNEVRYVPETDLQANKTANETRINELAEQHKSELSKYMGDESSTRTLLLQTQAENEKLKETVNGSGELQANLTKATADLEAATQGWSTASALALDFRKKFMVKHYGIAADKLEGKDMNQLTFFEEALGAVGAQGGEGNYALGGNQGATNVETTAEQRAQATLDKLTTINKDK